MILWIYAHLLTCVLLDFEPFRDWIIIWLIWHVYKSVSNEIKSINVNIQTLELITAVASNGDTDDMYPKASTAGVEGYSLLFKITFNNETIPPVVTIILQIYINYTRYNRYTYMQY